MTKRHVYHVTDQTRLASQRLHAVCSTMADTEDARKHLLLTEIFGVHPRVIVDALVIAANEHLYVLGTQLEEDVRRQIEAPQEESDREAEKVRGDWCARLTDRVCMQSRRCLSMLSTTLWIHSSCTACGRSL